MRRAGELTLPPSLSLKGFPSNAGQHFAHRSLGQLVASLIASS